MKTVMSKNKEYVVVNTEKLKQYILQSEFLNSITLDRALTENGVKEGRTKWILKSGKAPEPMLRLICAKLGIGIKSITYRDTGEAGEEGELAAPELEEAAFNGQTLEEFITECPTGLQVKIGCVEGSNYIYLGTVRDLDLDAVNSEIFAYVSRRYHEALAEHTKYEGVKHLGTPKGQRKVSEMSYKKWEKAFNDYVPLKKRKVVEVYESIVEDNTKCVIITGSDNGSGAPDARGWMVHPGKPVQINSDWGAQALAAAVYAQGADNLVKALETVKAECDRIHMDPYGILSDPQGIIDACHHKAQLEKGIRVAVIRQPGGLRWERIPRGHDSLAQVIGADRLFFTALYNENVVITDMDAFVKGKPATCRIKGEIFYGTVVVAGYEEDIFKDTTFQSYMYEFIPLRRV